MMKEIATATEAFARDVAEGLGQSPKFLSSRYFYNQKGDALFQAIMALDEYYLTRAEFSVFEEHKERLRNHCSPQGEPFRLIEFGAGDGTKTKVLLRHLVTQGNAFTYQPIDISQNVLDLLEGALAEELPECKVSPVCAEYFEALAQIGAKDNTRKMVLFLGSNIGNFKEGDARSFFVRLHQHLNPGDRVMIGYDRKKNPARVLAAYNDSQGVTREFNLNLLDRINEELGGNFDREKFQHWPVYDPQSGECRSYLVAKEAHEVHLEVIGETYSFAAWEPIFMEMSRKFAPAQIEAMAVAAGYRVLEHLTDANGDFIDSVWERV